MPTSVLRSGLHQERETIPKIQVVAPDSQELPAQLRGPAKTHTAGQENKHKRLQTLGSVWLKWPSAFFHS